MTRSGIALAALIALMGAGELQAEETRIQGKLSPPAKGAKVTLLHLDRQRYRHQEIATAGVASGEFSFRFAQDEPGLYRLKLPRSQRLDIALRPGQQLSLHYDTEKKTLETEGSLDTAEFRKGVRFNAAYIAEHLKPLSDRYSAARKRGDGETVEEARRALQDAKKDWFHALMEFSKTLQSPLAVYGIFTLYDWNYQIGDYDLDGIESIHRRFRESDPEAHDTALLGDVIRRYRGTAVGSILPDYPFPDAEGNVTQVSDLRGKYVLVEIWASWCVPCRQESPNLVENYERFRDDGFTIYSISFDDDRKKWLRAVAKDKRSWPHSVSDLQGSHSEATYLYCAAPPGSFLLDPEGRIIAKNLKGEALSAELEDIFKE